VEIDQVLFDSKSITLLEQRSCLSKESFKGPEKRDWIEETLAEGVEKKHALSLAEGSFHGFTTARVGPRSKVFMASLDGNF
jgi:hypothetical protein